MTKPRRPAWTALAGTLALLALLGMSDKGGVDVLAHVFGAGAGLGLGVLSASLQARRRTSGRQWLARRARTHIDHQHPST